MTVYGLDNCKPLAARGKIGIIFYSADIGKSARREINFIKEKQPDVEIIEFPGDEELKILTDKEKVKVLAVKRSKMLVKIVALAKTLRSSDGKEV